MQILFLLMSFVGMILLFFGVKWIVKLFQLKDVVEFPIVEGIKEFEINKTGLYAVCIVGGAYIKYSEGFNIQILNVQNGKQLDLKENSLKPIFRKKVGTGVEYLQFNIQHIGRYKIEIHHAEKLIVKKSMLKIKQLFPSQSLDSIEILIQGKMPVGEYISGIVFLVLGANMALWGVILGINPNLFG